MVVALKIGLFNVITKTIFCSVAVKNKKNNQHVGMLSLLSVKDCGFCGKQQEKIWNNFSYVILPCRIIKILRKIDETNQMRKHLFKHFFISVLLALLRKKINLNKNIREREKEYLPSPINKYSCVFCVTSVANGNFNFLRMNSQFPRIFSLKNVFLSLPISN